MKHIKFILTDKEIESIERFKERHRESCTSKQNLTAGEYWKYSFTPTGLGTIVTITCNLCGTEEDVTDVDGW